MTTDMDVTERVATALDKHPAIRSVRLVGSRADGTPTRFSDWDFAVDTDDFASVAEALPHLVQALSPIAQQWERLSEHACYMLILAGPVKVDLIFDAVHHVEPPWTPTPQTLAAIDDHFWDWILWLLSKEDAGREEVVSAELGKMSDHLLRPMGVREGPTDLAEAINAYIAARTEMEGLLGETVEGALEQEVGKAWLRRTSR